MRTFFSLIASVVLMGSASASAEQAERLQREESKFSVFIVGGGLGTEVNNSFWFGIAHDGGSSRWIAVRDLNETRSCGESGCKERRDTSHNRIDEKDCPVLRQVVSGLARVRALESGTAHGNVTDTPLLSLVTYRGGGSLIETERLSEYEGPLVDWWLQAEKTLKRCWDA